MFFWSASLWLDREEITFLFPILQNLHRSGKVAVCWFANYSDLSVPLLHLVKSPFWLFEYVYEVYRGSFEGVPLREKHVSRDYPSGQSHLLDEQYLFMRHQFPLCCLQNNPSELYIMFLSWFLKQYTKHILHNKYIQNKFPMDNMALLILEQIMHTLKKRDTFRNKLFSFNKISLKTLIWYISKHWCSIWFTNIERFLKDIGANNN